MSKKFDTEPGMVYTVIMSQAGKITALTEGGAELVLVSTAMAMEVAFQAFSEWAECSDDGAIIMPYRRPPQPVVVQGVTACQVAGMMEGHVNDNCRHLDGNQRDDLKWLDGQRDSLQADLGWLEQHKGELDNMVKCYNNGGIGSDLCGYTAETCTALGIGATTHTVNSTAIGYHAHTFDNGTVALGAYAYGKGVASTAIGECASAWCVGSVALGAFAKAARDVSVVIGMEAFASEGFSVAIGYRANAIGKSSVVLGENSHASSGSIAIGRNVHACSCRSVAFGTCVENPHSFTFLFHTKNCQNCLQVYFIAPQSPVSNSSAILQGCAGIGYKTKNISGVKKLSELLGTGGIGF